MRPIRFPQQNMVISKPKKYDESKYGPCPDLLIYNDGNISVTGWRLTWKERIKMIFGNPMWIILISGNSQPPMQLQMDNPFVDETLEKPIDPKFEKPIDN